MRTDAATAELIHYTKQVVETNHEIIRMLRIEMKQEFKLPELQKRWGLGRSRLLRLLRRQTGYSAGSGQKPTVNIADVLRIDRLVKDSHGIFDEDATPTPDPRP